jgi:hypothetical protein
VAAIAMSSATYAWFVNNAAVTATNVSVSASTAYSLLISPETGDKATWGTTTDLKATQSLTPVSTIGQINEGTSAITLTKAVAASAGVEAAAAVGIGDGTAVAIGDVRFVTNTEWKDNYITKVSEVSRSSKISDKEGADTYFYSDTVYLKAAQAGDICLDSNGIGISWYDYDSSTGKLKDTATLYTLAKFAKLEQLTGDSLNDVQKKYNEDLASAQSLLKTLRIGLLVTKTTTSGKTRTWHEYQLDNVTFSANTANTTSSTDTAATGITEAVSATTTSSTPATDSVVNVASITNAQTMTDKTIESWAIASDTAGVVEYDASTTDVIATVDTNEEVQVDIYIWMEGCDVDTVAAHINDFSGAGVSGLQIGFCLGEAST